MTSTLRKLSYKVYSVKEYHYFLPHRIYMLNIALKYEQRDIREFCSEINEEHGNKKIKDGGIYIFIF